LSEFDRGFEQGSMAAANLILTAMQNANFIDAARFVHAGWEAGALNGGPVADPTSIGPASISRDVARQQGFTGDSCNTCGSMKMQVAGHCTVCAECGTTTGCS
jgi:formate dehydrogenase maturation protein FdhE